jgi:hypothetical protein
LTAALEAPLVSLASFVSFAFPAFSRLLLARFAAEGAKP